MAGCQTPTQPLSHSPSEQDGGENKIIKLVSRNKDKEITLQLPSWAKQSQLGEDELNVSLTKNRIGW